MGEASTYSRGSGKPRACDRKSGSGWHPLAVAAMLCFSGGAALAQGSRDLTTLSLEQLLDVTVVGASKYEQKLDQVAAAASVITRSEIQAFGWRTIDEALASLPGVWTSNDRQYVYLGTRGFSVPGDFNTRVLVTLNGNRLNDPIYDGGPMGRQLPFDLDLVERLEFIPGPGGAVYGQNAMFGVVNIVTRDGAGLGGGELVARVHSPGRGRELRASWGRRLDSGVEVLLSASVARTSGQDLSMDFGAAGVSGVAQRLNAERDRELYAHLSGERWSLDLLHGRRRAYDPTGSYFSDPLVPGQYQQDGYTIGQFAWNDRYLNDRLDVSARLFAGTEGYRSLLYYGTAFSFPADGQWAGAELRLLWTGFAGHKLMFGLETQDNRRQDQFIRDVATPANDIAIPGSAHRTGVYVQDEWQIVPTLVATLGLRVDRQGGTGTTSSPRAALIWHATANTTIKALVGRAHRQPNAYERDYDDGFAVVANPALRGERVDTAELVADHRVGRDLALRASAYRWTMRGLIGLGIDPVSGVPQYQSGADVDARGVELSADKTWSGGARLRASASLQDVSGAGGQRPVNSPRLLGRVNAILPLPWAGLQAGVEWSYLGSRLTLDGSRLGGHALTNLHLRSAHLLPGLELGLTVTNLFDKAYAHAGADSNWQNALPADGRGVRLTAAWRF